MKLSVLASFGFLVTASAFTTQNVLPASRFSASSLNMATPAEFVDAEIESNDVVVFSKSYCPFCTKTKELFNEMGVEYAVHELDQMGDQGPELQMALFQKTEQKSVPNVFVKQQHIGGNDDTQAAAKAGKLQELLGV
mmetsp:Transcript_25656/g.70603  ORF Transcript_25656/g.70603 Transcript_25656/m.70603 type:complete len:137 (-) Transcript_25656:3024-3434(-)